MANASYRGAAFFSWTPTDKSRPCAVPEPTALLSEKSGSVLRRKEIYDRVYGQLLFPPELGIFIDSPQMQRLRGLMQLGNSHYVYPSATHTRFEHSLGVAHLAMVFMKQLIENHALDANLQRALSLPGAFTKEMRKDICCLGIAGLCHDLGHGPLSHMFESYVNEVRRREGKGRWSHEEASILMLRRVWHDRLSELEGFGFNAQDLCFVELLIRGLPARQPWPENHVGRPPWKRFMTDIIANKRSGLDVDKLDYIQRDSLSCLGSRVMSSVERLFQGACVLEDDYGETQICYQEKLDGTIEEVFINRARLFRLIYLHRVSQVMDQMTLDAFLAADKSFLLAHEGRRYRLSETVDHPEVFLQTGDWVVRAIHHNDDPALNQARVILQGIQCRHIYKTLGYYSLSVDSPSSQVQGEEVLQHIQDPDVALRMQQWQREHNGLCPVVILKMTITKASTDLAGMDPLQQIRFFIPRADPPVVARLLEPNECVTAYTRGVRWETRFVAISRVMHISASDLDALIESFMGVVKSRGTEHIVDHSRTPQRQLRSTVSTPNHSNNCSQGEQSLSLPLPLTPLPKRQRTDSPVVFPFC